MRKLRFGERETVMPDWVWIAVFVVAYVLLTRWILPRLGVPT